MTHILIPIEVIEHFKKNRFTENAPPEYVINELLKLSKQISLDEKDIELKAEKYSQEYGDNLPNRLRRLSQITLLNIFRVTKFNRFRGYKKALKDLI